VDDPPEELSVVGHDEEGSEDDEGDEDEAHLGHPDDAEDHGAGEANGGDGHEGAARDGGAQGPTVEFVDGVGGHPDGEEEGQEGGDQTRRLDSGGETGSDHDVGEVPGGVGRVEQGPPVAPAPAPRRVVRGTAVGLSHRRVVPT